MKELSLHIERLLLRHDCVVVPHFGAFVVRDSAASRSEQENLFFPPSRLVRFNPDVKQDDNLLVGAIRDERQCSVADAKRAVQGMVLNLRQQLLADSQVDFGTIGVFMQDEDGELSFSSCQAGVTTPRYYGLDVFTMPRLAAQQPAQHTPNRRSARIRNIRHNDDITIHISRRALRNVVAAAAIAVLCVLFTTPFELGDATGGQATVIPSVPKIEQTQKEQVSEQPAETMDVSDEAKSDETNSNETLSNETLTADASSEQTAPSLTGCQEDGTIKCSGRTGSGESPQWESPPPTASSSPAVYHRRMPRLSSKGSTKSAMPKHASTTTAR